MTVELFFQLAGFFAVLVGGMWALVRVTVRQFEARLDDRFNALEESRRLGQVEYGRRIGGIEDSTRRLERELLQLKADLPIAYVRREDAIRSETVINAKLDALASKFDLLVERQRKD